MPSAKSRMWKILWNKRPRFFKTISDKKGEKRGRGHVSLKGDLKDKRYIHCYKMNVFIVKNMNKYQN